MLRNQIFRQNFLKLMSFYRKCSDGATKSAHGPVAERNEESQEDSEETFKVK